MWPVFAYIGLACCGVDQLPGQAGVWARRPRVADADGPATAQIGQIRVYLARVFSFETIKSFTRSV
jgi:hypothetical protein